MIASRNQIFAAMIVILFAVVIVGYAGVTKISEDAADSARTKAEAKALVLANAVERKAFVLAVDTCRNTNPSRAFLQLRSRELEDSNLETTYTTRVTAKVFALVNCVDTVRLGRPVLLPPKTSEQYIEMFKNQKIATTKGDDIVGFVSFDDYFTEDKNVPARSKAPAPLPPASGTPSP